MHNTMTLKARRRRTQAVNFLRALRAVEETYLPKGFKDLLSFDDAEFSAGNVISLQTRKVIPTRVRVNPLHSISLAA